MTTRELSELWGVGNRRVLITLRKMMEQGKIVPVQVIRRYLDGRAAPVAAYRLVK